MKIIQYIYIMFLSRKSKSTVIVIVGNYFKKKIKKKSEYELINTTWKIESPCIILHRLYVIM